MPDDIQQMQASLQAELRKADEALRKAIQERQRKDADAQRAQARKEEIEEEFRKMDAERANLQREYDKLDTDLKYKYLNELERAKDAEEQAKQAKARVEEQLRHIH